MDTEPSIWTCELHWSGENGDYETFSRLSEVKFPGGQKLQAGAAHKVQSAAQTNPEEVFAAAVGSCMMMTILAVFSRSKVTVVSYDDKPEALLEFVDRRFRVTKVTLRPRIAIAGPIEPEKLQNLVGKSHANCFITLSVKAEVIVEPTFVSAV